MENIFSLKPVDLYLKGITKQPDKLLEVIKNNGQYTMDWNWFIVKSFMNKLYFTKRKLFMIQLNIYNT